MAGSMFSWRQAFTGLTALSQLALTQSTVSSAPSTTANFHPLFSIPASADEGLPILPNIKDPEAINAQDVCPGYTAENVQQNANGFTASLHLAGAPCSVYGNDVPELNLKMSYESDDRLNLEIVPALMTDDNSTWFQLPDSIVHKAGIDDGFKSQSKDLEFNWGNTPSFWFNVKRRSNGDILFDTEGSHLVFEDQFLEVKTSLPKKYNLYGLGETLRPFRLGNNYTKTMYNSDNADTVDANIYGTHPIYYDTRYYEKKADGSSEYISWDDASPEGTYESFTHGLYFRNAHGHEILMREEDVTWRTIGGSIDLTFFAGPTVADVAKSYQLSSIGLPAMQQYFALGYHQCKWGYANWSEIEDVVSDFEKFGVPLETVWSDIDYMSGFRDFSTDAVSYPLEDGQAFIQRLHDAGQHYVPITDSAIYIPNPMNESDAYETFNRGNDSNAFLLNPDGSLYIGAVWPGYTVFPDWLSEGTGKWWTNEIVNFQKNGLAFDGLWIDMSEVSSFCIGSCGTGNLTLNPAPGGISNDAITDYPEGFAQTNATEAASASSLAASASATATSSTTPTSYFHTKPTPRARNINYPPYALNNILGDLATHAVSPNATHQDSLKTQEYDLHNVWGYQILNATYNALLATFPTKRPFIVGRSQFAGAGKYASHWGGDNASKWYDLVFSISQALQYSLFGIPMFGVDTCGFNGNTDAELCSRWMQLSAFFPFYRNHNTIHALPQEPYRWSSVLDATLSAMDVRYALLPYMYTLFNAAHTTGSTVMRALAWDFPSQPNLANADRQFLLGSAILITPVLDPGATTVQGVFPGAQTGTRWYDWYNRSSIASPEALSGANITLDAPIGHIPVHVKGGSVLPLQPRGDKLVTRDMRTMPWEVLVALDSQECADGELYLDDGESLHPSATRQVQLSARDGSLKSVGSGGWKDGVSLQKISVMGVQGKVSNVALKLSPASYRKRYAPPSYAPPAASGHVGNWTFDEKTQLLDVPITGDVAAWDSDWTLTWS